MKAHRNALSIQTSQFNSSSMYTRKLQTLFKIQTLVKNFAVIYVVDVTETPDFNTMYELYDPVTCMFFFRTLIRF